MMDDPQVGVVAARVSNLESQVSQIEGRQESTFLGRNENGVPQAAADPGGRVAWTSEWRDGAGKMVAYIPGNALVIDGVNVAVEAQNKQNDEVPLTAGTWYLHIYRHKTNDSWEAEFNQGATGIDDEDWKAKYDIRIVDIHQDGYVEKQYVVGSIVIGKGGVTSLKGEAENSAKIDGDVEITGKSNAADETTSCGIEFLTIAAQPAQQGAAAQPAKIVAKLKNRSASEALWGKHTLSYTGSDGQKHSVEVLGNSDGEIPAVAGEKGDTGVGIGSVEEDPSQASGRTRKYKVMSDEDEPKLLGTLTVTDGRSIGTIALKSTSGKTKTYSVMSNETPAQEIGTFTVTDGADGDDGTPAGFGAPTATATELESGATPTASVTASGPDTAKVFAFQFGIPKGKGEQSDWKETDSSADSFINNKPTSLKNPCSLTIKQAGEEDKEYDGSEAKVIEIKKTISKTEVTASASPNGMNTIKFIYTDGTYDEFNVMNGLNGAPGTPGQPGEAPDIELSRRGSRVYVYVDGTLAETIEDGHTPTITAKKVGKITTIYADGNPIATINDGAEDEGELTEMDMVSSVTFSLSGGKLVAHVAKKRIKAKLLSESTSDIDVANTSAVDVVTSESYSTSTHQFTNTRRRITVLGDVAAIGETPFTATPLSSEE